METLCDVTKYWPGCIFWWVYSYQTLFTGLVAIVVAGLQVRLSLTQHRWNMEQNKTQQALAKVEVLRFLRSAYQQWDKISTSGAIGHALDGTPYLLPDAFASYPVAEVVDPASFSQLVAKAYPDRAVKFAELQHSSSILTKLAEEYKEKPWLDVNDLGIADQLTDRDRENCRLSKQVSMGHDNLIGWAAKTLSEEGVF